MCYPVGANEPERLAALDRLQIMGSEPDPVIDRVCRIARDMFSVPTVAVSLLGADQQWFKAKVGLDIDATPRAQAFCNHTILEDEVFVVPDATQDPRFLDNPLVGGETGIRFYAGTPLALEQGIRLGTLCLVDSKPRTLSDTERMQLRELSSIVVAQLELHRSRNEARARSEALLISQERLRLAVEATGLGTWEFSAAGRSLVFSPEAKAILGLPHDGEIGYAAALGHLDPHDRRRVKRLLARAVTDAGRSIAMDVRILRRSDHESRWLAVTVRAFDGENGRRLVGTIQDVTDLQIRALHQQGLALLGQIALQDANIDELLHASCDIVVRTLSADLSSIMLPNSAGDRMVPVASAGARLSSAGSVPIESSVAGRALNGPGSVVVVDAGVDDPEWRSKIGQALGLTSVAAVGIRENDYQYGALVASAVDSRRFTPAETNFLQGVAFVLANALHRRDTVTSLKLRDRALEAVGQGIAICDATDPSHPLVYVNPAIERDSGYTWAELKGKPVSFLLNEDYAACRRDQILEILNESGRHSSIAMARRKDGTTYQTEMNVTAVRNEAGQTTHYVGVHTDITQRLRLEAELRQSQKMDAVGKLTGGVAHDFNNLLTVILGNAEIIAERSVEPELKPLADMIVQAAERGADIVQRLLAFGRRQALQPERIDVNDVVTGLTGLLQRALGEEASLCTVLESGGLPSNVDRSQLETAILNLVLNARDAMARDGTVTIRTDDVDLAPSEVADGSRAGTYVCVSVTDTGCGIAPDVLEQVFEPFFTTKEIGKGTGLGLSMVYGFVQQSGGYARITSKVGRGTTVEILLPRTAAQDAAPAPKAVPAPKTGRERILVIEDQDDVRAYVSSTLTSLGYDVAVVPDGQSALRHLRGDPAVELLFSDIIMPGGIDGVELAERAAEMKPGLRIVFTSGYSDKALERTGRFLEGRTPVLKKPYRRVELAGAIRAAFASG